MTDAEKNAAATAATKETWEKTAERADDEKFAATKQKLISEVITFDDDGEFIEVEDDGEFDLEITGEDVKGKHNKPSSHDVTGTLKGDVITLKAADRTHTGVLFGKTFIGIRKPKANVVGFDQEEGIWVGTKTP